jgi:ABC-type amino acid transport substrate-binding protein
VTVLDPANILRGLAFGVLFLAGCATSDFGSIPEASDSLLRVGITVNYPPLVFKDGGKIRGLEIDHANALATALGRTVHFVEVPWSDQVTALEEGKTDIIMSGMSITAMRSQRANFANPYLEIGQMLLVRRTQVQKYANPLILLNTQDRVGVIRGTTGDLFVQDHMGKADRVEFRMPDDAVKALLNEKIDVFISDAPSIWWLSARHEADGLSGVFKFLTKESLAWAISRNNSALLLEVNEVLIEWREDGTLDRLRKNWIP